MLARLSSVFAVLGCLAAGALASAAGCNGTGTTPVCTYADGANDPDAGCGVLVEASAEGSLVVDASQAVPGPAVDASKAPDDAAVDATSPHVIDAAASD